MTNSGASKYMSKISSIMFMTLFMTFLKCDLLLAVESHTINAEARRFVSDIVYIQPGDSVAWINMTSHNSVSIEGMIPEGAEAWRSDMGDNYQLTLNIEGVYAYVCEPHLGFGMVGLIVVGEPVNLKKVREVSLKLQGPYRRILGKLRKLPTTQ
jgi:pseudoazurin